MLSCNKISSVLTLLAVISFLALPLGSAHGANVTDMEVKNIQTAGTGLFTGSVDVVSDSNTLSIGLNDFAVTATGGANSFSWAFDTISFSVTAPEGHVITNISYNEAGTRNQTGLTAFTAAIGSLTVGGVPKVFGPGIMFPTSGETGWDINGIEFDFSSDPKSTVDVSITNLIAAVKLGLGEGEATIGKTTATLEVTTTMHTPIPGAAWLLGSGLFGLIAWRRRATKSW